MDKIQFGSVERHLFMIRETYKLAARMAREKHGIHGPAPIYKSIQRPKHEPTR